jgi:hypothetical protein
VEQLKVRRSKVEFHIKAVKMELEFIDYLLRERKGESK